MVRVIADITDIADTAVFRWALVTRP